MINKELKNIINSIKSREGITQKEIAERLGLNPRHLSSVINGKYAPSESLKNNLHMNFGVDVSNISSTPLVLEPQKAYGDPEYHSDDTIPLLPLSAQAGSLNDFVLSVKNFDCERIISPIKDADFAISVSGDSMFPEYPSGAQVLIKKINEKAFIDWGRVFVLDTCNGTIIKKLMPSDDPSKVMCVSINPAYPSYEISLENVYGIYKVMMCMAMK